MSQLTATSRTPRMANPAALVPGAVETIQALAKSIRGLGAPPALLELVHLRASQINGCSLCVNLTWQSAEKAGGVDERLFMVPAWREAPNFTDGERAALALAEAMTRLADQADPVPDEIWEDVERHFDEKTRAALVLWIAMTNLFNRVNVTTRQPPQRWG
ncbi:MAG TPA: carboxymuconolactone decarboxylase family protein [Acidimicrobiales bacterium]|nr:carboxymuconolactone decarboxylase family protein [Acidimicrobiales bacterium]